jgi:predicted DCC family thiol-disulfide oxidoreductase YuxK
MKTLAHHVLIFDNKCPLCKAYTGEFVKTGMLDENGREAYSSATPPTCTLVNMDRARNEIALVNTKSGQVYYGIDSLFRILGNAFPVFAPLFRLSAFRAIMKQVYSFISYNRKVIIPVMSSEDGCVPDFNLPYRLAYIISTWLVTSYILTCYANYRPGLIPASHFGREFLICGGQIAF